MKSGLVAAGGLALAPGRLSVSAFAGGGRPTADAFGAEVSTEWFDLSLRLVRETAGYSPPVAARALAYAGITLFEAIVPGIPSGRSLAGRSPRVTIRVAA